MFEKYYRFLNFSKSLTFAVLPLTLVFTQFGCTSTSGNGLHDNSSRNLAADATMFATAVNFVTSLQNAGTANINRLASQANCMSARASLNREKVKQPNSDSNTGRIKQPLKEKSQPSSAFERQLPPQCE